MNVEQPRARVVVTALPQAMALALSCLCRRGMCLHETSGPVARSIVAQASMALTPGVAFRK